MTHLIRMTDEWLIRTAGQGVNVIYGLYRHVPPAVRGISDFQGVSAALSHQKIPKVPSPLSGPWCIGVSSN